MDTLKLILCWVVGVGIFGMLFLFLIKGAIERQHWLDKHCKVIGEMSGSTSIGYAFTGKGGMVVTSSPGKTGYQCDDGKQYWE